MKNILLTNDDGFEAKGLLELAKKLGKIANVVIAAPSTEKSGSSQSLTLTRPLRFIKIDENFYKLDDATPADCVYLGLHALFKTKPDLIVSGINHGANIAEDITCSGTCGAAMQGALQGIPSLAVSQFFTGESLENSGFDLACDIAYKVVCKIFENGFPLLNKQFLNLNIPSVCKKDFKGLKIAPAGRKFYDTNAQNGINPRGKKYYWLGKMDIKFDISENQNTDIGLLSEGFATLTPIKPDMTAYEQINGLEKWLKI